MDAALEHHYGLAALFAEDHGTAVTGNGGNGEVGDICVGDADGFFQGVGIVAKTTAQNQANVGAQIGLLFNIVCSRQNFCSQIHRGFLLIVKRYPYFTMRLSKIQGKTPVAVITTGAFRIEFGKKRGRKEDLRSFGNAGLHFREKLRFTASATFLLLRYFLVLNIE